MTSLHDAPRIVQPAQRRIEAIPTDSRGVVRPDLIPVAAYLCTEGYWAPEYALDRLADGQSPADLVRIGLLEPCDEIPVALILARSCPPIRGGAPVDLDPELSAALAEPRPSLPLDAVTPFCLDWSAREIDQADRSIHPDLTD